MIVRGALVDEDVTPIVNFGTHKGIEIQTGDDQEEKQAIPLLECNMSTMVPLIGALQDLTRTKDIDEVVFLFHLNKNLIGMKYTEVEKNHDENHASGNGGD
jgi:hypothetical protein